MNYERQGKGDRGCQKNHPTGNNIDTQFQNQKSPILYLYQSAKSLYSQPGQAKYKSSTSAEEVTRKKPQVQGRNEPDTYLPQFSLQYSGNHICKPNQHPSTPNKPISPILPHWLSSLHRFVWIPLTVTNHRNHPPRTKD